MGFIKNAYTGMIEQQNLKKEKKAHKSNIQLCIPHLRWKRSEGNNEIEWYLFCSFCGSIRAVTNNSMKDGRLLLVIFHVDDDGSAIVVTQEEEKQITELFYKQFPDADAPRPDVAQKEREEYQAHLNRMEARYEEEKASKPHCPNCNSIDVRPISTAKRVASTTAFGLASSTIGKSYECKKCGYKW